MAQSLITGNEEGNVTGLVRANPRVGASWTRLHHLATLHRHIHWKGLDTPTRVSSLFTHPLTCEDNITVGKMATKLYKHHFLSK